MTTEALEWMTHETELGLTVQQIGEQIAQIAKWIDADGNRGYSKEFLKTSARLPVNVLDIKYKMAWDEILFHGEGTRSRDFIGWGAIKRTPVHWSVTWLLRYGTQSPLGQQFLSEAWDAAHIEKEARRVKRKIDQVAGQTLEELDTITVAYYAAMFEVLGSRARRQRFENIGPDRGLYWQITGRTYDNLSSGFENELRYRVKGEPQPRRSKKQTNAAREDWTKAAGYLEQGTRAFFTNAYVEQCIEMEGEPDLTVDFKNLPRGLPEEMPIMRQTDRQVINAFMTFLAEGEEGSFQWEDARLILNQLRTALARAKGQHNTIKSDISERGEAEV